MQKYNIDIVLDAKQAKSTISDIDSSAKSATFTVNKLAAAIGAVITVQSLRSIADAVQRYQEMSERVRMATKSHEEFIHVQQRLQATADGTYRSLAEAQEVFIRTSSSLQTLGYTTNQAIDIVDSMSYAFVRNATASDRAQIAINSFSRALSKGKLDVDGWEMLMVAIPTLADDIAKATGKSTQEIRLLGATGKLSLTELTEGFRLAREENKKLADGMQVNLTDAGVRVTNALTNVFVKLEENTGAVKTFTSAIVGAAEYVNEFVQDEERFNSAMETAGSVAIVLSSIIAGRLVASFVAAARQISITTAATAAATGAMSALRAVLVTMGGPIGIIAGIATAAVALTAFGDSAKKAAPDVDELTSSIEGLKRETLALRELQLQDAIRDLEFIGGAAKASAGQVEFLKKQLEQFPNSAKADEWRRTLIEQEEKAREYREQLEQLKKSLSEVQAAMSSSAATPEAETVNLVNPIQPDKTKKDRASRGDGGEGALYRYKDETDALKAELDIRMATTQIYLDYGLRQQAETMNEEIKQLKGRTEAEIYEVNRRFQYEREARLAQYEAAMADERINDENKLLLKQEYQLQEQMLEQIHQDELFRINEEAIAARAALDEMEKQRRLQTFLSLGNDLLNASQGQSKRMFEIGKKASLASAAIDGVRSALSAWRSGMETPGPYAPLVAAAYTASSLLKTGALINQIRSASYGGSGSLGGGGGVGSASVPTGSVGGQSVSNIPQVQQQKLTLEFIGSDSEVFTLQSIKEAVAKSDEFATIVVTSIDDAKRRGAIDA